MTVRNTLFIHALTLSFWSLFCLDARVAYADRLSADELAAMLTEWELSPDLESLDRFTSPADLEKDGTDLQKRFAARRLDAAFNVNSLVEYYTGLRKPLDPETGLKLVQVFYAYYPLCRIVDGTQNFANKALVAILSDGLQRLETRRFAGKALLQRVKAEGYAMTATQQTERKEVAARYQDLIAKERDAEIRDYLMRAVSVYRTHAYCKASFR